MRSPDAIRWLPPRLAQIPRSEHRVEIIKERSVVQEGAASAALRVAGYLARTDHEIGSAGQRKSVDGERVGDPVQDNPEAARDVSELGIDG